MTTILGDYWSVCGKDYDTPQEIHVYIYIYCLLEMYSDHYSEHGNGNVQCLLIAIMLIIWHYNEYP